MVGNVTSGSSTLPTPTGGGTNSSTLSEWAGPYVTSMLGKAQATAAEPYQTYQGPLTAGPSALQNKIFQGLGNLAFPSNLGQSFSSTGAYQIPQYNAAGLMRGGPMPGGATPGGPMPGGTPAFGGPGMPQGPRQTYDPTDPFWLNGTPTPPKQGALPSSTPGGVSRFDEGTGDGGPMGPMGLMGKPMDGSPIGTSAFGGATPGSVTSGSGTNIASNYMNPYLQNVLTPQLDELRRQYDISGNQLNAKAASQGAFGGSRNALQSSENDRNMMQEMNKTIGTGYANAYDKAMNQFNVEQGQAKTLADMIAQQGGIQQGLEQAGVTADYNEFVNQRDYPQTQLKFMQSMLQGLPISTVYNTPVAQTPGQQTIGNLSDATALLKTLGVIKG